MQTIQNDSIIIKSEIGDDGRHTRKQEKREQRSNVQQERERESARGRMIEKDDELPQDERVRDYVKSERLC